MPHRAPGSPGKSRQAFLTGKPIRYYRPKGSAEIRRLVDEGFQAFNAGRLSEACQIFSEKMLAPENDTTIGLTVAGAMTPAGLGGCVIEMMDRGLVDFVISTGANLYHDLHYALNFTLRRGSPFLNDVELYEDRRHPDLRRAVSGDGAARDRRLHPRFHRPLGAERADRDLGVPLSARPRSARAAFPAARSIRSSRAPRWPACRSTPRRQATARSA